MTSSGRGEDDAISDKDDKDKDGDKHRDKEQEKRDTDGHRPIDPAAVHPGRHLARGG
jgi:hypothetical protein